MKSINDLPNDAILDIFDYLDGKNLKVAMKVCKKWNRIIAQSPSTLSRFKFVLPKDWNQCRTDIIRMTNVISSIEFKDITIIDDPEICKVLGKLGGHVKVLILDHVTIDPQLFTKLISMFQLDKLIVNKSKVSSSSILSTLSNAEGNDAEKDGRVIKLIAVSESDELLINVLAKLKMQSTKIAFVIATEETDSSRDPEKFNSSFADFMKQQKCLKQLVFKCAATKSVLGPLIELLKQIQLDTLAIALSHGTHKPHEYDGLAELITCQPALTELEIRSDTISQDAIHAIHQSLNLQKVKLNIEKFPVHLDLPTPCRPHDNLKSLIVDRFSSEQSLDAMLRMFARVEKFCVNYSTGAIDSSTVVTNVQNRLKSLRYLKVAKVPNYFPGVNIPSLRKFQVDSVASPEALQFFLYDNPQLQEVELGFVENHSHERHIFDFPAEHGELTNMQRLTIRNFSSETDINERVLRGLRRTFPSLTNFAVGDSINVLVDENIAHYSGIKLTRFNSCVSYNQNSVFQNFTRSLFYCDIVMRCIDWEDEVDADDDGSISDFEGWDYDRYLDYMVDRQERSLRT